MARFSRAFYSIAVTIPLALAPFPGASRAQAAAIDHFNVYIANGPPPPAAFQSVQVTDQFGSALTGLGPARLFLVPTVKNDELIQDPSSHLTCYDALDPKVPAPQVIVTNQLGSHPLQLLNSRYLCAPTAKLLDPPGPVNIDHYLCYDAAGPVLDIGVSIQDQFQAKSAILLEPTMLCAPADKNGEGIQNPVDHLACYSYTPAGQSAGQVPITNQFFPDQVELSVQESFVLCVPSTKDVVESGLDRFTVYDASGPDGPVVNIVDQWGAQTTDLGPLDRFLVPASKNLEGISDPISHLACNAIVDGAGGGPPEVWAVNQFGHQQLAIGPAESLCTPTEKLITPGPVNLDHYKCYQAAGPPLDIDITFADQFQAGAPVLLDPFWFCNPAEKNGERIQNPDDHLACFFTNPPGPSVGVLQILNQFLPAPFPLEVNERFGFCVPSCKDSDGDGHCDPNDNCPNHFNPGQADTDFVGGGPDGIGDVCDPCVVFDNSIPGGLLDANGDLIPNVCQCGDPNLNNLIDSNDLTTIFGCLTAAIPPATCTGVILGSGKGEANNNSLLDSNDLTQIFGALTAAQPNSALTCTNRPEGTPVP